MSASLTFSFEDICRARSSAGLTLDPTRTRKLLPCECPRVAWSLQLSWNFLISVFVNTDASSTGITYDALGCFNLLDYSIYLNFNNLLLAKEVHHLVVNPWIRQYLPTGWIWLCTMTERPPPHSSLPKHYQPFSQPSQKTAMTVSHLLQDYTKPQNKWLSSHPT
jgi:hypothetical protein